LDTISARQDRKSVAGVSSYRHHSTFYLPIKFKKALINKFCCVNKLDGGKLSERANPEPTRQDHLSVITEFDVLIYNA